MGPLEATLALDTPAARDACAWACRHRTFAGAMAVVLSPRTPTRLSFQGSQHSWVAYRDTMDSVVLSCSWNEAMQRLVDARVPVLLASGGQDRVIDPAVHRLAETQHANVRTEVLPHAGHDVVVSEPAWVLGQVRRALSAGGAAPAPPRGE